MRADNQHIIQKQTIEINFENLDDSVGLQNHIAEVFYKRLQPRMEVLFDEIFGKNNHASIDKLEIDCGLLHKKNWEQEFTEQAISKLKEELVHLNREEIDIKKIEETAAAESFFFFLENGFMPWNNRISAVAELEQLLSVNEKLVAQLKILIAQKAKAAERLVWQFSKNFTSRIITELTKNSENALNEIFALLEKLNLLQNDKQIDTHTDTHIDKHIVDAAILNLFASDENKNKVEQFFAFLLTKVEGNEALKSEIKEIINYLRVNKNKSGLSTGKENQEPNKAVDFKKEEIGIKDKIENEKPLDSIYIDNAGLVLLHPFLPSLFDTLKLIKGNDWLDELSQQKAVLVLEFLATGKDETEEFDLMLNKILCGIDLQEIVSTEIQLEKEIKVECDMLLSEVITQWSVLKNTSIDGLREAFLKRNGKFSKVENGWLLQVEQESIDILLNQLPWGIGIVKLPWMNDMLFVEWT